MKKITLAVFFMLFIFGCAGSSKTIKPSEETLPRVEEKMLSENLAVMPELSAIQPSLGPIIASIEPMPIEPIMPVESMPETEPERISYSQITNLIRDLIDIKEMSAVPGEDRYLGISDNKLVMVEVAGDKEDIIQASMKLIYPKDIDKANTDLNNAMMARFLKNAAPEFSDWPTHVKDILARLNSIPSEGNRIDKEDIIIKNKLIEILYDRNVGSVTLTLRRAGN